MTATLQSLGAGLTPAMLQALAKYNPQLAAQLGQGPAMQSQIAGRTTPSATNALGQAWNPATPAPSAAAAATPGGLTNPQNVELQKAVQAAFGGISGGETAGSIDQQINQMLQGSNLFNPTQMQAIQSGEQAAEPHGAGFREQGGSAAPFDASWLANINQALANAPGGSLTTAPVTSPVSSTPATQKAPATGQPTLAAALNQGYNPLQAAYLGLPPTLSPTMYGGTTVGNAPQSTAAQAPGAALYGGANVGPATQIPGAQVGPASLFGGASAGPTALTGAANVGSPQQTINQLYTAFQPEAAQQEQNLNNTLAAFGISGGPAVQAQMQLSNALASGLAPQLGSALLSNQQLQANLSQGAMSQNASAINQQNQYNAGLIQSAGQGNQSAINSLRSLQAQLTQAAQQGNQSAITQLQQLQAQLTQSAGQGNQAAINAVNEYNASNRQQTGLANQQASLSNQQLQANLNQQAGLQNTAYANQAAQTNLNDILNQNLYNANIYNQGANTIYDTLQNNYNTLLQAYMGLNSAGLSGGQNLANTGLSGYGGINYAGAGTFPVQTGMGTAAGQAGYGLGEALNNGTTSTIPYGGVYGSYGTTPGFTPIQGGTTYGMSAGPITAGQFGGSYNTTPQTPGVNTPGTVSSGGFSGII